MSAATALHFVCPEWCQLTQADHLGQIPELEDGPVHEASWPVDARLGLMVGLRYSSYVNGEPYEPAPELWVVIEGSDVHVDAEGAVALARALVKAAKVLDPDLTY